MEDELREEFERGYDKGYYDGSADAYNNAYAVAEKDISARETAIKPKDYIMVNDCFSNPKKVYLCPICKSELVKAGNYCFKCGQKIDWEERSKE